MKKFPFFLYLLLFSLLAHAQGSLLPIGQDIRFIQFRSEDGFSMHYSKAFHQDSHGFMWNSMGEGGLVRYDGYSFKDYNNNANISSMKFSDIIEDAMRMFWLGARNTGLVKFDPDTEISTNYFHEPDNPNSLSNNYVQKIYLDQAGILWITLKNGWLNKLDPITEIFTRYQINPNSHPRINDIIQSKSGDFWLGADDGLYQFNPETGRSIKYQHKPDDSSCIGSGPIRVIIEDADRKLWVGCDHESGLILLDRDSGKLTHFLHDPLEPHSISNNSITSIYQDSANRLWVGTNDGLNLFQPDSGHFVRFQKDESNSYAISGNIIVSIYEDRGGVLWFGTTQGINRIDPKTAQFKHYKHLPSNPNSLSSSFTYSIHEDDNGILWIGDDTGALNRFDRTSGQVTRYQPDASNPQALNKSSSVSAIYEGRAGTLWIGTYGGGLHNFDRASEQFQRYLHDPAEPHSLSSNIILSIYKDKSGSLWIGTRGGGLNRFDRQTGQFHRYPPNPDNHSDEHAPDTVRAIYEDQLGFLWLTGIDVNQSALTRFDPNTEQFYSYRPDPNNKQSLSSYMTYSVHEDQNGYLWIGTSKGLNKFDRESNIFTHYTVSDGLPNNNTYAIVEDASGYFWISTNSGMSKFNPRTEQFKNFDVHDGLQQNEFNQGAFFQSKSGEIFFGGINGVTAFYPEQITESTYRPPVQLTNFKLSNISVTPGKDSILQKPIWDTEQITLNYDQNVFSFEFSALSYATPANNHYRYKLEGLEKNWNEVDAKQRVAAYIKVPPGDYVFRVLGSNNHKVWNEEGTSVKIIITPPWWQTNLFRGLAALFIVGIIVGIFIWQRNNAIRREYILKALVVERTQELKNTRDDAITAKKDAEIAKANAETANLTKSSFLANISHELRTPLSVVLGFSELMARDPQTNQKQNEILLMIKRSSQHLLNLINDVLDISKIEAGRIELKPEAFGLSLLLYDIDDMFRLRTEKKDLHFSLDLAPRLPQYVLLDMGKLRQVLINLLGNAIKFTKSGEITLRADAEALTDGKWNLHFEVEDTGVGISAEKVESIFEAFTQIVRSSSEQQGTGLGLAISRQYIQLMGGEIAVESTPNKGSLFRFNVYAESSDVSSLEHNIYEKQRVISLAEDEPEWRILIVEDMPDNRLMLRQMLENVGFIVYEAANGKEGVQQFLDWQPQLIWMDMRMPVMDGYEATRRIRELPGGKQTKILALTASSFTEKDEDIINIGCDSVLHKPYFESSIFTEMEKRLGLHYIYEETNEILSQASFSRLRLKDLQGLPDEWLVRFLAAVRLGNKRSMFVLTKSLATEHAEIQAKLNNYIEEFRFFDLINILEEKIGPDEKT